MNPSLANFILKKTPDFILHPTKMADTKFTLNTGAKVPALGLGTWQSAPGEVTKAVSHALKVGYRHVDAAYIYGNEDEVGAGLKEGFDSGIKREDVFVTTKLWCTYHSRVEENLDKSLSKLGLDYVDLYLMHWPVPMNPKGNHETIPKLPDGSRDLDKSWSYIQTWKEMEKVLKTGKTKAIGVANFSVEYLEELLPQAEVVPAMNQIECHPYLAQHDVGDYCKEKGILITAYSPFGSTGGPLFQEKEIQEVAKKHDVTPGCVLLSYHIARGNCVIPKSVNPSRIEENMRIIKFDHSDLQALDHISKNHPPKRLIFPAFGLDLGFPDKKGATE